MSILNINKPPGQNLAAVDKGKKQKLGKFAEKVAENYLKGEGFKILEKNFRKPWGEIDIIAKIGDALVFVEVKANSQEFRSEDFSPETRVDEKKIRKITKTAKTYIGDRDVSWRVDIVSITFIKSENKAKITHFKNVAEDLR